MLSQGAFALQAALTRRKHAAIPMRNGLSQSNHEWYTSTAVVIRHSADYHLYLLTIDNIGTYLVSQILAYPVLVLHTVEGPN